MRIFLQRRWRVGLAGIVLVGLALLALVESGSKKKDGAVQQKTTPPAARVETSPASAPPGETAPPRKLVILPETPTAQDSLQALFQCDSGRVVCRWERDGELLAGEERNRLDASYLKKGATITAIVENNGVRYSESVTIGNISPVVSQVTFKNPAIHRGVDIELLASGEDADGDDVTFMYQWFRNGSQMTIDGPRLPGDRFSRGDQISFQVVPFDGMSDGIPYEGSAITIPNAPPAFVSTPPLQFLAETYSYQARAEDPDNDAIVYSLEGPPPGMRIDRRTGDITWPLAGLPAGTYRINIVADDGHGQKGYQEYSLTMSRQGEGGSDEQK